MTAAFRGGLPVNPPQAAVVDHVVSAARTVVSAGAGSGKTHTMLAAVLEMVERRMVTLDRVALITFTNAAADVLRERLQEALQARSGNDPYWQEQLEASAACFMGTIHGFCHRLLQRYSYMGTTPRTARVSTSRAYLRAAIDEVIEDVLSQGGPLTQLTVPEYELRERLGEVHTTLRNSGHDLRVLVSATVAQPQGPGRDVRLAFASALEQLDDAFRRIKREEGVVDLQDLLRETADIFLGPQGDALAADTIRRWDVLLVDEFQDTDGTQKAIIDCLARHLQNLLVVGDPKQSIYRFRGADVSLLQQLAEEQMGASPLRLPIARRPTHALLRAQNALFRMIADRYPEVGEEASADASAPQPAAPLAPLVYLRVSAVDEIRALGAHLRSLFTTELPGTQERAAPGDVVVLVRSNQQIDKYVEHLGGELQPEGVPVVAEAGESFYSRPAVVATFRVLASLLEYPNDALLSAALATPYFPGVDPAAPESHSLAYGVLEGSPLTDWFEGSHPELAARAKSMRDAARTDTAPQFLARLYDAFQIKQHFLAFQDALAVDDLERLREQARRLFRNQEALTVRIFTDWLRYAIQQNVTVAMDDTYAPPGSSVRVMTVHRAKGREFPIVVIPGMNRPLYGDWKLPWFALHPERGLDLDLPSAIGSTVSTTWPAASAEHRQAELREEMRLLYVAVTRAEHQVVFVTRPRFRNDPDSDFYSWGDEVLRVYDRIPGAV